MDRRDAYVRVHALYIGRVGMPVGVFVAVDHLRRADLLSLAEEDIFFDIDDHFNATLSDPPFYRDGNTQGAVTWFIDATTAHMQRRLEALCTILDAHGVAWSRTYTDTPGRIIYTDDFQVGAIPATRRSPTEVPHGLPMSASTPGSKRSLGKRARGLE